MGRSGQGEIRKQGPSKKDGAWVWRRQRMVPKSGRLCYSILSWLVCTWRETTCIPRALNPTCLILIGQTRLVTSDHMRFLPQHLEPRLRDARCLTCRAYEVASRSTEDMSFACRGSLQHAMWWLRFAPCVLVISFDLVSQRFAEKGLTIWPGAANLA